MKQLYKVDNKNQTRVWQIEQLNESQIQILWGVLHGVMQSQVEDIPTGLAGRSLQEQVDSRIKSRINKQYDLGYKDSLIEATELKGTNAIGLFKPMLAQPLNKIKNLNFNAAFVQPKYDGHRCLITKQDDKVYAYSRRGKYILSVDHILGELSSRISEGETLDGELYCHGVPFQTLTSWIKRKQPDTLKLKYHVYDIIEEVSYNKRFQRLNTITQGLTNSVLTKTILINSLEEILPFFRECRRQRYEGTILRWGDTGYEVGKRSRSLVKIKEFLEDEFKVVAINSSADGWAVLLCECNNTIFKVSAPGSIASKEKILQEKEKYIGKYVTVQYSQLTEEDIPFHPVALRFREDI